MISQIDLNALHAHLANGTAWWHRLAREAVQRRTWRAIPSRDGTRLYLPRFWLSEARPADPSCDQDFDSGDSVLLHCFMRPDDDGALHDHPWEFRSTILEGAYTEDRPAWDWSPSSPLGPQKIERRLRVAGQSVLVPARGLHAVSQVQPYTWTLVQTGRRVREWGFHPAGRAWQPWQEFLAAKGVVA